MIVPANGALEESTCDSEWPSLCLLISLSQYLCLCFSSFLLSCLLAIVLRSGPKSNLPAEFDISSIKCWVVIVCTGNKSYRYPHTVCNDLTTSQANLVRKGPKSTQEILALNLIRHLCYTFVCVTYTYTCGNLSKIIIIRSPNPKHILLAQNAVFSTLHNSQNEDM